MDIEPCPRCDVLPEIAMGGWDDHEYVQLFCVKHRYFVIGGRNLDDAYPRWNEFIRKFKK